MTQSETGIQDSTMILRFQTHRSTVFIRKHAMVQEPKYPEGHVYSDMTINDVGQLRGFPN